MNVLADSPAYLCSLEPTAALFRRAIADAVASANAAAGTTFSHFLDNTNTVSPSNVTECPHPNDAGHVELEAAEAAALPF